MRFIPRRLFFCSSFASKFVSRSCRPRIMSGRKGLILHGSLSLLKLIKKSKTEDSMPTLTTTVSRLLLGLAAATSFTALAIQAAQGQSAATSFFVTSNGIGSGANLGGLPGADNHCQTLAQAAGAGGKTWHAYLSTQAAEGKAAENARDRIGKGPWQNAKGAVIAKDIAELHGTNNLTK